MIPLILAADTSISIPLDIVLWVAGAASGLIGGLIALIYRSAMTRIREVSSRCRTLEEKVASDQKALEERVHNKTTLEVAKIDNRVEMFEGRIHNDINNLHARIENERNERITKHEEAARRFGDDLERTKEKVNDVSETVAGIGSVYLTRNEFTQHQLRKT